MGAIFNGIGALPMVLNNEAQAPMQYRCLVPYIVKMLSGIFGKGDPLYYNLYIKLKWSTIPIFGIGVPFWYFSLIGINPYIGTSALTLFYCLASLYDYGETYLDVGFLGLTFIILTYSPHYDFLLLFPLVVIAALNKETAAFIPFTVLLTGDIKLTIITGFGFIIGYIIPIISFGVKERYCNWIEFQGNWHRYKMSIERGLPFVLNGYFMFLVLFATVTYCVLMNYKTMTAIEWSMVCLFYFTIPITIWNEIRMWSPVMLVIIPLVMRRLV